jgi:RimJ/RimL family protein N-acetyltransferase
MKVLETDRLILRWITVDDAPFILELLNDPGWLNFIGDRGVRTTEAAREYISKGPVAMVERLGFGLYLTERKSDGIPMGICGLIKRDGLNDVDIGFAFLPQFGGMGYATEAATATMDYAKNTFGLRRIVGITSHDNDASIRLLEKIGLKFETMVKMPKDDEEVMLFAWNA